MEVVPLTDFQHGGKAFREGVPQTVHESMAADLERGGLVRVKMAPPLRNQMAGDPLGKAPAGGEGTPSASSRVAQVSPSTTVAPPKRGRGRPRKTVT